MADSSWLLAVAATRSQMARASRATVRDLRRHTFVSTRRSGDVLRFASVGEHLANFPISPDARHQRCDQFAEAADLGNAEQVLV